VYYVFSLRAEVGNGELVNKCDESKIFVSLEKAKSWYLKTVKKLNVWLRKSVENIGKCSLVEIGDQSNIKGLPTSGRRKASRLIFETS